VFLRVLEYYSGILFLTTNRVGAFDDAFKSRVHLSLHYPALDENSSKKVWEMNLRRTIKHKTNLTVKQDQIIQFATDNFRALNWNGRQIRNAFQTAIALAEFEANKRKKKAVMSAEGFATVARASRMFDLYLLKTHQAEESLRASREQMRYDKPLQPLDVDLKMPAAESSLSETDSDSLSSDDSDYEGLTKEEKKKLRKEKKKKRAERKKKKKLAAKAKEEVE